MVFQHNGLFVAVRIISILFIINVVIAAYLHFRWLFVAPLQE